MLESSAYIMLMLYFIIMLVLHIDVVNDNSIREAWYQPAMDMKTNYIWQQGI